MLDKYFIYFQRDIVANITVVMTLLPLSLIIYRKAYIDPSFRLLLFFLIFKLIVDLIMFHYAVAKKNNLVFSNVTIIVRYALLSGMFYYKFENKSFRKFLIPITIVFSFFTLWDIWNCNPVLVNLKEHRIVKYAMTIESLLMIVWTLIYFYELIRSLKIQNLLTFPFFWICSGILIYYSSLIFISPALHYAIRWEKIIDIGFLDSILYIFDSVILLMFSMGIWFFSARYYARQ